MEIDPRPFGQMLGDAVNGLARVWKALMWPAIVVSAPVSILTIAAFAVTGGDQFMEIALNNPSSFEAMSQDELFDILRPFYIAVAIASVLQILVGVFLTLTAHRSVAIDLSGGKVTTSAVVRQALNRYGRALWATTLILFTILALLALGIFLWLVPLLTVGTPNAGSVVVALILFFALLGPAIWAGISVSMTTAVVGLEDRSAVASIQRSMRLVRGRWWATAGFLMIVGLLGGIAVQLIQLIAYPFAASGAGGAAVLAGALLGVVAQGVIVVLVGVTYTHWYIDLRARKEPLTTEDLS